MTDRKEFVIGPDGFCQFERDAMECAARLTWRFGITDETDQRDVVHEAWIIAQARKGSPGRIGWLACQRIRSRRHFQESNRSIDHPVDKREGKPPNRISIHVVDFAREGDNPADLAAFWIDFTEWRKRLPKRKRNMVRAFLKGVTTREAAGRFKCSPGRISQIRRELETNWEAQFAEI